MMIKACVCKRITRKGLTFPHDAYWGVSGDGASGRIYRCMECRGYVPFGPANDASMEVTVECRAAELAMRMSEGGPLEMSWEEGYGWEAHTHEIDTSDGNPSHGFEVGWLANEIFHHDEYQDNRPDEDLEPNSPLDRIWPERTPTTRSEMLRLYATIAELQNEHRNLLTKLKRVIGVHDACETRLQRNGGCLVHANLAYCKLAKAYQIVSEDVG